jgi:hypothetical protein
MSRTAKGWQYSKGLHDLGNGCYGYLQPDGSWGWSNAGLVVDGGESLLVDTLFDLKLTRAMLDTMHRAELQSDGANRYSRQYSLERRSCIRQ